MDNMCTYVLVYTVRSMYIWARTMRMYAHSSMYYVPASACLVHLRVQAQAGAGKPLREPKSINWATWQQSQTDKIRQNKAAYKSQATGQKAQPAAGGAGANPNHISPGGALIPAVRVRSIYTHMAGSIGDHSSRARNLEEHWRHKIT